MWSAVAAPLKAQGLSTLSGALLVSRSTSCHRRFFPPSLLFHSHSNDAKANPTTRLLNPGQPAGMLKRLRRGQYSIRSEIDLHQMTEAVARSAVTLFLNEAIRQREYCVRIVHGKGSRSASRGPP